MSQPPLASLCIPLYNKAQHIAKTLEASLQQTYPHFEIVVSDNGSTDGSTEIARAAAQRDSRIKYHRLPFTIPINQSWRYAMLLSQGEFVKIHSADDPTLEPRFLERMIEPLLQDRRLEFATCATHPIVEYTDTGLEQKACEAWFATFASFCRDLLNTPSQDERARKLFLHTSVFNQLGNLFPIVCRRCCFPASHWRKNNTPYDWPETYPDWDFLVRLFLNHRGCFVEEVVAHFHYDAHSPVFRIQANNYADLLDSVTLWLLPFTVLTDPELAPLRRQARPEELTHLVQLVQERIPQLMALSDEVVAFSHPHFAAALLPKLAQYSASYRRNPADEFSQKRLRQLRLSLAQHWLETPGERIEQEYQGAYGEAQRLLLESGIRQAKADVRETDLFEQVAKKLRGEVSSAEMLPLVLTFVLFASFGVLPDRSWQWVPDWLRPDLARFGWSS